MHKRIPQRSNAAARTPRPSASTCTNRILLVQDGTASLADFRRIFADAESFLEARFESPESSPLFDVGATVVRPEPFEITQVDSGREGLERVMASLHDSRPFQVAFIDLFLPSGWSGAETLRALWHADPRLQVVICGECPRVAWSHLPTAAITSDALLVLRKPLEPIEVHQVALAMGRRWHARRDMERRVARLERELRERSRELDRAVARLRAAALV